MENAHFFNMFKNEDKNHIVGQMDENAIQHAQSEERFRCIIDPPL
jgi:hypothetical protein